MEPQRVGPEGTTTSPRRGTCVQRARRWRHERGQGGAVLLEAALVFPVMMILAIGIMEFGLLYTSHSTTTASSRSGARLAATEYSQAGWSAPQQEIAATNIAAATAADLKVLRNAEPVGMVIYKVNPSSSNGAPYGGFPSQGMTGGCSTDCIRYRWDPGSASMEYVSGSWTNPDACGVQVDSIGVYVEVRHDFITRAFRSTSTVGGHTVMRLEPLPTDQCSGVT